MKPFALSILLFLVWSSAAWGQAWPQAKGKTYSKISYGYAVANNQINFEGIEKPYVAGSENVNDPFKDASIYWYTETGLTDNLTLMLSVPYKQMTVQDELFRYETSALSNIDLGLRIGLLPLLKKWGIELPSSALATNIMVSIPTGYTRNYSPSVGTGQLDVAVSLNYGRSFYPAPIYAQIGTGYRYRSTAYGLSGVKRCVTCLEDGQPKFEDEFSFNAEVGGTVGQWALVHVLMQGLYSLKSPTPETSFTANNPLPTRQQYVKGGIGMTLYPLRSANLPLGIGVQYFWTLTGKNTIRSNDLFLGIEYQIQL